MNSVLLPSSLVLRSPSFRLSSCYRLQSQNSSTENVAQSVRFTSFRPHSIPPNSRCSSRTHQSSIDAAIPSNDEGPVAVINFEDFMEKDWSFLDFEGLKSNERKEKIDRIISAGGIQETSRVLVSISSEDFVDYLVDASPTSLVHVVHDSLFLLAITKEKYDKVKCWHGELIHMPEKWAALDVIFLYFLPALPFKLDQIFQTITQRCSQGARVVISHPQGREVLEQQRKQHQDVIISELPDKQNLQKVANDNLFEMTQFVDEPEFYLAVLQYSGAKK